MTEYSVAATLGDREGVLAFKVEELLPRAVDRFGTVAVRAMTTTHERNLSLLERAGVAFTTTEPDAGQIGRYRREALGLALAHGSSARILYMDFDHLLRWIENDASELDRVLDEAAGYDCGVIGRSPRFFSALPERLAATESIVNHVYRLMTGRSWDLMMAARSLSRRAAGAIVDGCTVDTIGNDVAWPLFCEARGFSVGYVAADGLTYRTNADYAVDRPDARDADPRAWATRVLLAGQHVEAMLPYMDGHQPWCRPPTGTS